MLAAVENQNEELLTIGDLSKRTGISTHTLRMWEKRYDSPKAIRLPSGHRRYRPQEIERLRAVARIIKLGFRASKVVGNTLEELQGLMGFESKRSSSVSSTSEPDNLHSQYESTLQQWLEWIEAFDEENLNFEMHREWGVQGPLSFITHLAAPLIKKIGSQWECGDLTVAQEHFASEVMSNFLGNRWRRQNERKPGKTAVLATLPGENHSLGLQMCAVVLSTTDWKIISLGRDTPEEDIVKTMNQCGAPLLCVSVSGWYGVSRAKPLLARLRSQLGTKTEIVAGGSGAPGDLAGIRVVHDFLTFHQWLIDSAKR